MTPPGETCKTTFDWFGDGEPPGEGDGLRTATGRTYLIIEARRVRSAVALCRMRYDLLVLGPADEQPGRVYGLRWNPR